MLSLNPVIFWHKLEFYRGFYMYVVALHFVVLRSSELILIERFFLFLPQNTGGWVYIFALLLSVDKSIDCSSQTPQLNGCYDVIVHKWKMWHSFRKVWKISAIRKRQFKKEIPFWGILKKLLLPGEKTIFPYYMSFSAHKPWWVEVFDRFSWIFIISKAIFCGKMLRREIHVSYTACTTHRHKYDLIAWFVSS